MALIEQLVNKLVTRKRAISEVYSNDPAIASDTSLGVTLSTARNLLVVISGFSDGGDIDVTIVGDQTETVNLFSKGESRAITTKQFASVDSVTVAGLGGKSTVGKLEIFASSRFGDKLKDVFKDKSIYCRLAALTRAEEALLPGAERIGTRKVFCAKDVDVLVRDQVVIDSVTYSVVNILKPVGLHGRVHHLELRLREI